MRVRSEGEATMMTKIEYIPNVCAHILFVIYTLLALICIHTRVAHNRECNQRELEGGKGRK
jgi:hypothetical protein